MNASFQDCSILNKLIKKYKTNWSLIFSEFSKLHVKNGHAIVDMALENYIEMRDHVNDPEYIKRRQLELKLERMFPEEFIPRYSMVSFHQIDYSEVYSRGEKQFNILEKILNNYDIAEVDKKIAKTFMLQ
jgi:kynurenine 3-monooxygenase